MSLSRLATVLLCLMLALAGCGAGPGGNDTTDSSTASGVDTQTVAATENGTAGTATGENAAAGANASGNGTLDTDALESRHVQAVREAGSVTVVVNATSTSDRVRTSTNASARVDLTNETSYQQSESRRTLVGNASDGTNASAGGDRATTRTVALYTANDTTFLRAASGDGEPRYRTLNGAPNGSAFAASNEQFVTLQGVFDVVDATNWTRSENATGAGTTHTASGADSLDTDALFGANASGMAGNVSGDENASTNATRTAANASGEATNASGAPSLDLNVTAYDATLVVSENGTVEEFTYEMTVDLGDRETTISRSYEVRNVGETIVEEPSWLDDAREQANGTPSGADGTASANASA